jgi:hypothetical protein
MQRVLLMALAMAFGAVSPALAQQHGGPPKEPTLSALPPPAADVHTPLCVYHNFYYSAGALVCVGTGWAQICQPGGSWGQLMADPRTVSMACGDAKSVPPS